MTPQGTREFETTVTTEQSGTRIDVLLSSILLEVSRTEAQALTQEGNVRVNGTKVKPSQRVRTGDIVQASIVPRSSLSAEPEDIPLSIVYQDDDLVVIDKPAGLVVHPAAGHESGTLANALAAIFPQTAEVGARERPGIVHRLDKDTSGLMVVALTPTAYASLQRQISERSAGRRYLALVAGHPRPSSGTISGAIGRDPRNRLRMAVDGIAAREARTAYRVLAEPPGFGFVEARLETGRTHQIRVHLAAIGNPIVADSLYGGPKFSGLERQFLHAYALMLTSPSTGERFTFYSRLPEDLESTLTASGIAGDEIPNFILP